MKDKGDQIEFKLEQMIHRISVHTDAIENSLGNHINSAKEHYKIELQKTINTVKEENSKVYKLLEDLKSRMPLPEA